MESPLDTNILSNQLTDIAGLRLSGVFPKGKEPALRTLREWTRTRRIPYYKVGRFTCSNTPPRASAIPIGCYLVTVFASSRRPLAS